MEHQQNFFALALKQADAEITDIDSRHDSLQAELDMMAAKKNKLITTRCALLIQVGDLPADQSPLPQTSVPLKSFKGMSFAAAARKYLFDVGRPQTHAQVVEALIKGNIKIASKHPGNSIRTSMQKHPEWFRWVKRPTDRGQWELVEWPIQDSPVSVPMVEKVTPTLALVSSSSQSL
jgi:hypothetical protein